MVDCRMAPDTLVGPDKYDKMTSAAKGMTMQKPSVYKTNSLKRYCFPTHCTDLIIDRQDSEAVEVFFAVLKPGEKTVPHKHDDCEQLWHVIEGCGTFFTGPEATAAPGSRRRRSADAGETSFTAWRTTAPACCDIWRSTCSWAGVRRMSRPGTRTSRPCAGKTAGTFPSSMSNTGSKSPCRCTNRPTANSRPRPAGTTAG